MSISKDVMDREFDKFVDNGFNKPAVRVISSNYASRIVIDGTNIYIGKAAIGSLTSAAVWQIKKIDTAADIIILFADGDDLFDNIMDDATTTVVYS